MILERFNRHRVTLASKEILVRFKKSLAPAYYVMRKMKELIRWEKILLREKRQGTPQSVEEVRRQFKRMARE